MGKALSAPSGHFDRVTAGHVADLCVSSFSVGRGDCGPGSAKAHRATHTDSGDYCDVYIDKEAKHISFILLGASEDVLAPNEQIDNCDDNEALIAWHRHMRQRAEYFVTKCIQHIRNCGFEGDFHDYDIRFGGHSRGGLLALYAASDFIIHMTHSHKLNITCVLCIGAPKIPPAFNGFDKNKCVWVTRRRDLEAAMGKSVGFVSYGHRVKLDVADSSPHGLIQYVADLKEYLSAVEIMG